MCAIALASNLASPNTVDAFVPAANHLFPSAKTTTVSLEHNNRLKLNTVASRPHRRGNKGMTPLAMMLPTAGAAAASAAAVDWALAVVSPGVAVGGESSVELPSSTAAAAAMMMLAEGGFLEGMDAKTLGLFAFAGVGVAAAGFKTAVYWRMQYVVSLCVSVCVCVFCS